MFKKLFSFIAILAIPFTSSALFDVEFWQSMRPTEKSKNKTEKKDEVKEEALRLPASSEYRATDKEPCPPSSPDPQVKSISKECEKHLKEENIVE